jgi:hypothetical protein
VPFGNNDPERMMRWTDQRIAYAAAHHTLPDVRETFRQTAQTLERVFAFLREDASIPHVRALPYIGVLPILTRFFG